MISFANLLTLHSDIQTFAEYTVAPYVGAWIETYMGGGAEFGEFVAPYVGAWIETKQPDKSHGMTQSHPTWVRGLKHVLQTVDTIQLLSHPTWVRGLKHGDLCFLIL